MEAALAFAAEGATRTRPVILVIDELPYLTEKEPSIEAVLQKVWDRALQHKPVLVILIGSDEASMSALTEPGRPLYDRAATWRSCPSPRRTWVSCLACGRSSTPTCAFWLRFVNRRVDLIERGRGSLLLDELNRDWTSFRGRAIEPLIRDSVERRLPGEKRLDDAHYVGAYWNRTGSIEVDLVGGDAWPIANRVGFVGSIKWRARSLQPRGRPQAGRTAS